VGLAGLTYLAVYWLVRQLNPELGLAPLHERPAVIYSVGALLLGGQLLSVGLLAELITAHRGGGEDSYSIAEQTPQRKG
jgi:hypothetical protein